ncbi:hypothetical protein BFP70_02975 [Thioclava sp. SK-1]|uniref:hypothetical protein n=1 Tax=Thioclava sp. SK-1 TaxID=1889770 RepID=UPI000826C7C7|nr:hypothetical protein [Thioclava sp. SK-1]OCX67139.1 hypothetical protein BFP70_02975 [Thioclava sp. SK-1]
MAFTTASHGSIAANGILGRMGRAIFNGLVTYMERKSRRDEIERLQRKSDEELAAMGLKRDQIAYHVFRDMMHY